MRMHDSHNASNPNRGAGFVAPSRFDRDTAHRPTPTPSSAPGDGRTRFVWTADVLPDELGDPTSQSMVLGIAAIEATLSAQAGTQPVARSELTAR